MKRYLNILQTILQFMKRLRDLLINIVISFKNLFVIDKSYYTSGKRNIIANSYIDKFDELTNLL